MVRYFSAFAHEIVNLSHATTPSSLTVSRNGELYVVKSCSGITMTEINSFISRRRSKRRSLKLSEEAYAKLDAERAEGESFESVIERLTRKRSLRDIVGFLKENEAAELERTIEALRARSRERTLKLLEELNTKKTPNTKNQIPNNI